MDDLFVDINKILKQTTHEEKFRGHVLSMFTTLENIIGRIIAVHNASEKNYWKYFLEKVSDLQTHKKIQKLSKILKQKKYENQIYDFKGVIKELYELKEIRNQLAHNIINPHKSDNSARKSKHEIALIVIKKSKVKKISFGIKKQKEIDDKLNHVYSQLKEMHRFVKEKNGHKRLEWYP